MVRPDNEAISASEPIVASIHDRLVRAAQGPLKTSNTASESVPGVTVIVCLVEVAVKEYQTSSSAVPVQTAIGDVVAAMV